MTKMPTPRRVNASVVKESLIFDFWAAPPYVSERKKVEVKAAIRY
jgi:hypothetical protein